MKRRGRERTKANTEMRKKKKRAIVGNREGDNKREG